MSLQELSNYTFQSKFSQYLPKENRKERWDESVKRVFNMHRTKYAKEILKNPELRDFIDEAEQDQIKKKVLASQRSLQFAADPIFKHELKMYNCLSTYIDRDKVFSEIMYGLLCGCGVGFSVQKFHIHKLSPINKRDDSNTESYQIQDSIEGWSDAIDSLINSYIKTGKKIVFDYSLIRPKGALIAGRFKAPGPDGLKNSIEKIEALLNKRINSEKFKSDEFAGKMRPIDAYDVLMFISDAVLSGGIRRSASLSLFSYDDEDMVKAKTGNWFIENPQRGRSNNSVALLRKKISREKFSEIIKSTKEHGEPGFIWLEDISYLYNPCVEIGMRPQTVDGVSGFQGCNLVEINGKYCSSKEKFLRVCKSAAIIGTLQAGYTNFKYLDSVSKEIFEKESLLGCSITGMMDNSEILFDPEIQREGAEIIKKYNKIVSKLININPAARVTCIKPAGTTSCILGTSSGIHPHHAKRYIRRTQVNTTEQSCEIFERENPIAIESSVWSANNTDKVISFLCEVPQGSIVKNQLSAIDLLDKIKTTQQNWVEYGTNKELCVSERLRHNVSNTITVKPEEWDEVRDYIYDNRNYFAGISLLPSSGDLDYPQAPLSTVLTPNELVKEYGDASVFASGLVVDGLSAFDNNLWAACDSATGIGEKLKEEFKEPKYPSSRNYKDLAEYFENKESYEIWWRKQDWIRRLKQFANKYFDGELKRATYCCKHVSLWKTWVDLKREYKEIDWGNLEYGPEYRDADTLAAQACSGGKCEII